MTEAKQLAQESMMIAKGIERYRRKVSEAAEKNRTSTVGAGVVVTAAMVPQVAKAVRESIDLRRRKRGPVGVAVQLLRKLKPEVSALIAVRTTMDLMALEKKATSMACIIGGRIEDELRFKQFKKQDPKGYKRAKRVVEQSRNYAYQHKVMVNLMKESELCSGWEAWTQDMRARVGTHLLDIMLECTDMVRKDKIGRAYIIRPTQKLVELMKAKDASLEALHPWFMPSLLKPKDWTPEQAGGYYSYDMTLVKRRKDDSSRSTVHVPPTCPKQVLEATNRIQATGWRVNADMLCVVDTIWRDSYAYLPEVPDRSPTPPPDRPPEIPRDLKTKDMDETQKEILKAYVRAKAQNFEANVRRESQLFTAKQITTSASMLVNEGTFYFPQQLDWRGRCYGVPLFLNPQGSDLARGLLEFAEAKPFGSEDAVKWFLIAGATHFGVDKVNFAERIEWVDLHHEQILEAAADPIGTHWWRDHEVSEPYQFLAWCFEYARWVESGRSLAFESRKVIGLDGSCNGLQHFSAMLRDKRGGTAVNLTPSEDPQDLYTEVLVELMVRLNSLAPQQDEEGRQAREWLKSGLLTRKMVKRQVMTLPYGATRHGMQDMLVDEMGKWRDLHLQDLPFLDPWEAALWLTGHIYKAITDVVVAARVAMGWLQDCARIVAQKGMPLRWRAPHGFVVTQAYRASRKAQIRTQLAGHVQLKLRLYSDAIDKRKQASGISPNFVHAIDATHMAETVCAMGPGVSWAMVHDSYGTHAADAERLALTLREEFIRLYEEHDVLAEFKRDVEADAGVELPDPPAMGELDLWGVLESDFFFA